MAPPSRWPDGSEVEHAEILEPVDLEPVDMECIRCHRVEPMRFYGPCDRCRAELHARFDGRARTVAVPEYEPKMNVTPNAVAVRDD